MISRPGTMFLLVLSILVQILGDYLPKATHLLAFRPAEGLGGWVGILTHQVTHGGWGHLIGNFSFGLPFMAYLEHRLGRARFVEFFVGCGIFSALMQVLMVGPDAMVGASGALCGVLVGACLAFGKSLPEHAVAVVLFMLFLCGQLAMAPLSAMTGIAVYGHIGGCLGGLILSYRLYRPEGPGA